jgi:hypothetical protein
VEKENGAAQFTSSIIKRISDGFTTVYSNSDLKKYDKVSPLFNSLPPEVNKVLLNSFKDLLDSDLCTIANFDPLTIPDKAVPLFYEDQVELINGEIVSGNVTEEPQEISLDVPFNENPEIPNDVNEEIYDEEDDFQGLNEPIDPNSENVDDLPVNNDRLALLRELETDREEEEKRQLERIEEEEEEEDEEEESEVPTGRANNRPVRFG